MSLNYCSELYEADSPIEDMLCDFQPNHRFYEQIAAKSGGAGSALPAFQPRLVEHVALNEPERVTPEPVEEHSPGFRFVMGLCEPHPLYWLRQGKPLGKLVEVPLPAPWLLPEHFTAAIEPLRVDCLRINRFSYDYRLPAQMLRFIADVLDPPRRKHRRGGLGYRRKRGRHQGQMKLEGESQLS